MAIANQFVPFNVNSTTTSSVVDLGFICNALTMMNVDNTDTIWIRLGETPETAAAQPDGANASFPLAPGEIISMTGIACRYIAHIASANTPVLKGFGLLTQAGSSLVFSS